MTDKAAKDVLHKLTLDLIDRIGSLEKRLKTLEKKVDACCNNKYKWKEPYDRDPYPNPWPYPRYDSHSTNYSSEMSDIRELLEATKTVLDGLFGDEER